MKKNLITKCLIGSISVAIISGSALAAAMDDVEVKGEARLDLSTAEDRDANLQSTKAKVSLSKKLTSQVKAKLAFDLAKAYQEKLIVDGEKVDDLDFDWERFVDEAAITFDVDQFGTPIAVAVGKQHFQIEPNMNSLPDSQDIRRTDKAAMQLVGVKVRLSPETLKSLVDSVDIFVAENQSQGFDMDFESEEMMKGIRVSKTLMEGLTASAGYVDKGNDDERYNATIEAVINESITAYLSTTLAKDNPNHDEGDMSYEMGGSLYTDMGKVNLSSTVVEDQRTRVAFSMDQQIAENIVIKPYVGYDFYDDQNSSEEDGWFAGAELKVYFQPIR